MMHPTRYNYLVLVFLVALLTSQAAVAMDDGGGRSVFARGAGERALALGGAFGAVASGPEAITWNPAGLARITRKDLYASHSNLIGMGFQEQLGIFALPSWRYGTFSLGLRRFGVDGIEGRDGRGTIFDDNLKDAETEILMGYGRKLGGIWDVGAVFKYQQQELAGYSAGSPGLDIGLIVKPLQAAGGKSSWANDLSLGFAIRNLIEPNLRLDEEGVKDPTGLRFGLALDRQLSSNLALLIATDLEKTRDMDSHLHAGAELRLLDILALRAGSNAGMLTAGMGLRYENFALDYAFEDNPLEPVHRFGFGLAFGTTVQESRQAHLAAEEARLQRQLAQEFQKESRSRLQTMIGQAQRAVDDGEYLEALNMIEACRVLDPGAAGLAAIEGASYLGHGKNLEERSDYSRAAIAYQRCLVVQPDNAEAAARLGEVTRQSDRLATRSTEIRQHFDKALTAYARGDLISARVGFEQVLTLNPEDREAQALLLSANQTLSLQAGMYAEQALTQARAKNLVEAKAALAKARLLDPEHSALSTAAEAVQALETRKAEALREARQKAEKTEPTVAEEMPVVVESPTLPSFAQLSAKEQQEVAELYRRGLQAMENHRNEDAVRYWELVWSRAPDYQQVAENLKREYLAEGMEAFASGQLDRSIEVWEKAQTVAPGDARTEGYLARAMEHKTRIRQIRGEN